jgi:hypothetical protein
LEKKKNCNMVLGHTANNILLWEQTPYLKIWQ